MLKKKKTKLNQDQTRTPDHKTKQTHFLYILYASYSGSCLCIKWKNKGQRGKINNTTVSEMQWVGG